MLFMRSSSTGGAGSSSQGGAYGAGQYSPRGGSPANGFGSDDTPGRALRRLLATARARGGGGAQAVAAGTGLVIDGGALVVALQPQFEELFLQLCRACTAVICCRVSPMQKAQVTRLLKKKAGAVTLAIGDGANDVSMIQAAHIGVGISGREGRAAVQAADYAFGQFRFLVRLLLVHGRYSYLRCREVVLYAFYKNVAYVSCYVYYAFYSGGQGQGSWCTMYMCNCIASLHCMLMLLCLDNC
jgi:magnesium-transporting ATPase (P-type)